MDLTTLQKSLHKEGQNPPVEKWNPAFCGDIDLLIKQNGQWFYMGSPIGRLPLVKLFASVLKRQQDSYFLVTPVEKVGIQVEDVPFIVTEWQQENEFLVLQTSLGDKLVASPDNPVELRFNQAQQTWLPYVLVRRNLWARLHQNVYYQLIESGVESKHSIDGKSIDILQVFSGDYPVALGYL
ncbi:DUF1285 domain-containing protein [Planctobacterium marinum]|uniref:DUF1285 domain-containing protein n=1 Tax=Planctobacterium marinum TaxID=1631968 RepID=A0AA48I338_9ALTE|nr:hypothetical protein MACH26_05610 [Planctobacterium marinum]